MSIIFVSRHVHYGRAGHFGSEPRVARLDWIGAAVELAQIGKSAHGEPVRIAFAGLEQCLDVLRHLGARLSTRFGRAIHQQVVSLHDAVDCGLHCVLRSIKGGEQTACQRKSSDTFAKQSAPNPKTGSMRQGEELEWLADLYAGLDLLLEHDL